MDYVNLAEAKAHFSELVAQAQSGKTVCILRYGAPVAQLTGVETPHKPIELSALRALTQSMPKQPESAGEFIRQMRDESRY